MTVGDKQEVSHLENSTANLAGRDLIINQGLNADDVIAIVKTVVASELAIYAQKAEGKAEERLKRFSDDLVGQLAEKVTDQLDRFNEPSVQFSVREAALGYVKSGSELDKNNLIDLMIERVKVEEHSTKQKLIDQAIRIVPTLSAQSLSLLSLLAFRQLSLRGNKQEYLKWLNSVNSVVNEISSVGALDIEYLVQAGCVIGLPGLSFHKQWEESCLLSADLFYRHPASEEAINSFMNSIGVQKMADNKGFTTNPSVSNAQDLMLFFVSCMVEPSEMKVGFNVVGSGTVDEFLHKHGLERIVPLFQQLKEKSAPFTKKEVRAYFENLNPNWGKVIEIFNSDQVMSFRLTPVGSYIGSRQLARLSSRDIPIEIFYHE